MATRKGKRKSASSSATRSQSSAANPQVSTSAQTESPAEDRLTTDEEFAEEYSYVRKDLRHLAVISLGLFAVMVVIGFLI